MTGSEISDGLARHERKDLLRLLTCGSVDDGKSTLIGRLLHDSKLIFEDELAGLKTGNESGAADLNFALLVDGLQAEREQGITIDVAYRYFSTARRKFIIADTPGHEQYTRNMVTGASGCDLAIILVDARNGVQPQTRRHGFIASLLGIRHIIVAVNKMDLVGYEQEVFDSIRADYLSIIGKSCVEDEEGGQGKGSKGTGKNEKDCHFIPLSALNGDNVVHGSTLMSWYDGVPLLKMLEEFSITETGNAKTANGSAFRFPVQYVNRLNSDFCGYCGTVASGVVRKGDSVVILPAGNASRIKSIVTYDGELDVAFADMAVTLTLEDELAVGRGDMIVHSDRLPCISNRVNATVIWMAGEALLPGKEYDFKLGCRAVGGQFRVLHHKIDINTLEQCPAAALELNEIGVCELELAGEVCFDSYKDNRATGAFIVIDRLDNATVGAGIIG